MDAIEAAESLAGIIVASAPYLSEGDRGSLIGRLERLANLARPTPPPPEIIEHDPARAAEYFAALGFEVV